MSEPSITLPWERPVDALAHAQVIAEAVTGVEAGMLIVEIAGLVKSVIEEGRLLALPEGLRDRLAVATVEVAELRERLAALRSVIDGLGGGV